MSGIVGSIGSKSGVISDIEQDFEPYQQKTWTFDGFTAPGDAGGANYYGGYMRIGRLVFVNGYFAGVSDDTALYINNLPYTADNTANALQAIDVGKGQNSGAGVGDVTAYANSNTKELYFLKAGEWNGWTSSSVKGAAFAGWYLAKLPLG